MEMRINKNHLSQLNSNQIKTLQILCNLEYVFISMGWYAGEVGYKTDLPDHEKIFALSLAIANLGEALHNFEKLYPNNSFGSLIEDSDFKKAWEFLKSEQVKNFKDEVLKYIRDKSTFHIDPITIRKFSENISEQSGSINIWEYKDKKILFSPLALEIIGRPLLLAGMDNAGTAYMTNRIFHALRYILIKLLNENFNVEVIE